MDSDATIKHITQGLITKGKVPPPPSEKSTKIAAETKALEKESSFLNSPLGTLINTAKAVPSSLANVLKDVVRAPLRAISSVDLTTRGKEEFKPETGIQKFIFGEEPTKSIPKRSGEASATLESFGFSPGASKILGTGAVVAGTALDLYPGAPGEGSLLKQLAKEGSELAVKELLEKNVKNLTKEVITTFAPRIAEATDKKVVQKLLDEAVEASRTLRPEVKASVEALKSQAPDAAKVVSESVGTPPDFEVPLPTNPQDSAISKLVSSIREAGTKTAGVQEKQSAELARRAAGVAETYSKKRGESAFNEVLSKLKGQLTEKSGLFDPVKDQLTTDEVDSLFNRVIDYKQFNEFEKVQTHAALRDLLEGTLPQPKQLEHLEEVFGHEVIEAIQKHTSGGRKVYDNIVAGLQVPRSLMTAFDMSAPFRQGLLLGVRNPKEAGAAFKEMFKQVFSETNFNTWLDELKASPAYPEMRRAGLYISDPRNLAQGLNGREEAFMNKILEKIPGVGASQRAYLGYLNKLRTDVFTKLSKDFVEQGAGDAQTLKALAEFVNTATGRGSLGKFGRIAPELNAVFFSPRLIAARLNMLNPNWYAKQPPIVRKEAMKTMATFVGAGLTVLSLAKLGGADVETDPRSTDFGKIKVGDTRWDIWGGFQQWARVFAQLASGQRKTTAGDIIDLDPKVFPFETRFDVAENFALGKLAPIPALGNELLRGQQMFGGDLTLTDTAIRNLTPLYAQGIYDAYQDMGAGAIPAVGIPAFFGVGTQTYAPSGSDKKSSAIKLPSKKSTTKRKPIKIKSRTIKKK